MTLTSSIRLLFIQGILLAASGGGAAERAALLIGNQAYTGQSRLENPVRDARAVAGVLKRAGFEIIHLEDANAEQLYEGLERLKTLVAGGKIAVIFFAGHGLEVEGKNYLLPVHATLETSAQLQTQAVALDTILQEIKNARCQASIVILDCCRDNPLSASRSWLRGRSLNAGLAELADTALPESTMILYSAGPGRQALDGTGENSPFTAALVRRLQEPGESLFNALLGTSDDVAEMTAGRQEPWIKFDGAARVFRETVLFPGAKSPPQPSQNVQTPKKSKTAFASNAELDLEDAMRGAREPDPRTGQVNTAGVCLRNAGSTSIPYQILTPQGWETRILPAGVEKVVILGYGGGIRLRQGGRFRKVSLTSYVQPHYPFVDPNLPNIERMARTRPSTLRGLPDGDVQIE